MLLNGTTSRAETTGLGGVSSSTSADRTIAAIVRRNSSGGWDNIVSLLDASSLTRLDLTISNANALTLEIPGVNLATGPTVSTGPMFVAADKAAGTTTPRFHLQRYGTDAAVAHSNAAGSFGNMTAAPTKVGVGSYDNNADWFDGDVTAVGIWNRQLADWEHEWLAADLMAWPLLNPDWLVIEDAAGALPTNVPDLSGKGAPLTTLTSLAVTASSCPVGWGAPGLLATRQSAGGAPADQSISGAGAVASGEAIGSHTLTPGAVTVSPGGVAGAEAFGAARLDLNVTGAGAVASGEAVGAHTLTPGAVTVSPGGIASGEAVGNPLIGQGVAGAGGIASGEAFGLATITPGPVTVSPSGVTSGEAFGQATLSGGAAGSSPRQLPTLGVG